METDSRLRGEVAPALVSVCKQTHAAGGLLAPANASTRPASAGTARVSFGGHHPTPRKRQQVRVQRAAPGLSPPASGRRTKSSRTATPRRAIQLDVIGRDRRGGRRSGVARTETDGVRPLWRRESARWGGPVVEAQPRRHEKRSRSERSAPGSAVSRRRGAGGAWFWLLDGPGAEGGRQGRGTRPGQRPD